MKKNLLFIIISMAFLFAGADAIAQDTKHADPRYMELDEHPTFKGGGPNNFASWVSTHVKYPKDAFSVLLFWLQASIRKDTNNETLISDHRSFREHIFLCYNP